jgi:hypothetical protein
MSTSQFWARFSRSPGRASSHQTRLIRLDSPGGGLGETVRRSPASRQPRVRRRFGEPRGTAMTSTCQQCGQPLAYKGTGRPRRYCSRGCKRRAERQRATSSARLRPPQPAVSPELRAALERIRLAEEQLRAAQAARAARRAEARPARRSPHLHQLHRRGMACRASPGWAPTPG